MPGSPDPEDQLALDLQKEMAEMEAEVQKVLTVNPATTDQFASKKFSE